ncbi:hypothetical protein HRG_014976 [Hirsutella rhossiliensis]
MPERLLHARLGHPGKHMEGKLNAATGRVWVYFSRDKTRITDKIKAWVVVAEAECREYGKGEKVKAMRFDRGKEFLNEAMKKVHEVRFVEFDESKYMDNEISQESQSQYDDEKEEKKEQGAH